MKLLDEVLATHFGFEPDDDDAKKLRLEQVDEKMRRIMVPVIRRYNDLVKTQGR